MQNSREVWVAWPMISRTEVEVAVWRAKLRYWAERKEMGCTWRGRVRSGSPNLAAGRLVSCILAGVGHWWTRTRGREDRDWDEGPRTCWSRWVDVGWRQHKIQYATSRHYRNCLGYKALYILIVLQLLSKGIWFSGITLL